MRILHIIDSDGLYGAEMILLNLVQQQIADRLSPVIASIGKKGETEKPLETEAERRGLPVRKFRMHAGPNIFGALEIIRFARENKFLIFHSHGYKGNILFGFMPPSVRGLPLVSTLHGWTSTKPMTKMRIYEWLDQQSLQFIDSVVVVNAYMLRHPMLIKKKKVNFSVVNNGIPAPANKTTSYHPELIKFCDRGFIIGSVGRLSEEKGYDLLIKALKDVLDQGVDAKLVLIGEGDQERHLKDLAEKLSLKERVYFSGFIRNAVHYIKLFDVFAISSLTEGLPVTLLETMHMQVPIVATSVGGIPDVLRSETDGFVVSPGSSILVADALMKVHHNPDLSHAMALSAKKRVEALYSDQEMHINYLKVYKNVLVA